MGLAGCRRRDQSIEVDGHHRQPVAAATTYREVPFGGGGPDLSVPVEKEIVVGKMLQESVVWASSASRSFPRIA